MKPKHCMLLLAISVLGSSFAMAADEITITHRSGKVQTIIIDNPDDPIEQVGLRRETEAAPAAKQQNTRKNESVNTEPVAPVAKDEKTVATTPEQSAPKNKPGVKVKWAQPIEIPY